MNMNYGYQPYNNYTNPYYMNGYGYQQNQTNQQQNFNNNITCTYVDSVKVVEATNCDMSGKPLLFMKSDGTEIYKKQLNPNTGSSELFTYEIKNNIEQQLIQSQEKYDFSEINDKLDSFKKEMSELKELMLESITTPVSQPLSNKNQQKAGDRR